MTDNEIIKALECCAYSDGCEDCPISKQCDGAEHLINALDLINRQKAEKDKAWGLCKKRTDEKIELQMLCDKQKAEIERLDAKQEEYPFKCKVGNNSEIHSKSIQDYDNLIGDIGAEAIKEFAERLKVIIDGNSSGYFFIPEKRFDNLVKEMVGDV